MSDAEITKTWNDLAEANMPLTETIVLFARAIEARTNERWRTGPFVPPTLPERAL